MLAGESVDLESSPEAANYQLCDLNRNKRLGLGGALTFTEHLLRGRHMSYLKCQGTTIFPKIFSS